MKIFQSELSAWRIADQRHAIFSGEGAAQFGGRWNSPGKPVIYAGMSFAVCLIEKLAQTSIGTMPKNQAWIEISAAKIKIAEVTLRDVPGWSRPDMMVGRRVGDQWLEEQKTVALIVPSMVGKPIERNLIINPLHPDFKKLKATKPKSVVWDQRLFGG